MVSLEDLIIETDLLANIPEKEQNTLRIKYPIKDRILLDFLAGKSLQDYNRAINGKDHLELLSHNCMDSFNEVQLMTPMKQLSMLAYQTLICSKEVRSMLPSKASQETKKRALLLDSLLNELTEERKAKALCNDVNESVKEACLLYIIQKTCLRIGNENSDIDNFNKNLGKLDIPDGIKKYSQYLQDSPPQIELSMDLEASRLLEIRKQLLDSSRELLIEKVRNEYGVYRKECENIEKFAERLLKPSPQRQDINELKKVMARVNSISKAEKKMRSAINSIRLDVPDPCIPEYLERLGKTITKLNDECDEYVSKSPKIRRMIRELPRIKTEFIGYLQKNRFSRCKRIITDIESRETKTSDNMYLAPILEETNYLLDDFSKAAIENMSKKDEKISLEIESFRLKRNGFLERLSSYMGIRALEKQRKNLIELSRMVTSF